MEKSSFKPLSFSTTMRNPARIAEFLKALLAYENQPLTHEIIMKIAFDLVQKRLYVPLYANNFYKEKLQNEEDFSAQQTQIIIENSPQNHKEAGFDRGWDSRFDTWYKLAMEFGFCFYAINEPLIVTNTGHQLIAAFDENPSNDEKISNIFLNCLIKYPRSNPFRKVLNSNVPLILLLEVMNLLAKKCQNSKIHKLEIAFFLCWQDDNAEALSEYILDFRKQYQSFAYSKEIIYELCLKLLQSENTKRFKLSQICGEAIDEYLRKMRITGIVSLRGNGFFLDFNHFEMPKIEYILQNYSSKALNFKDKQSYINYLGQMDEELLRLKEQIRPQVKEDLRQKSLRNFAQNYTKEQIFDELMVLVDKKSFSKDELFKLIPEPVRFEFLVAICLKQNFENLEVLPNYSIDDEGLPKCHASGNLPDMVCVDEGSKSIVEVSLICGRMQVTNELIPITRHLKELIKNASKENAVKKYFALFIAPVIFEDSKQYAKFLKFNDKLEIKNYAILDFIKALKCSEKLEKIL